MKKAPTHGPGAYLAHDLEVAARDVSDKPQSLNQSQSRQLLRLVVVSVLSTGARLDLYN